MLQAQCALPTLRQTEPCAHLARALIADCLRLQGLRLPSPGPTPPKSPPPPFPPRPVTHQGNTHHPPPT